MDTAPIPVETLLAHREWVRAVARAVVRDPNAADDVEQETWLAALRAPPREPSSLRGWFGAVTRSRARRIGRGEARRLARETAVARPDSTQSAAELVEIADTHRRVVQAVVELDEPYRRTILLRYFEGLAVEDVAARTGVPLDTARSRISRGLAKLRERLEREFGTEDRPWIAALAPLIGGHRESVAGAGVGAAAGGGAVMATKAAWALGAALAIVGIGAVVVTKWPASASEQAIVASLPAVAPGPAAPPAAAPGDGAKGNAPAPPAPKPESAKTAGASESAAKKLERTMIDGKWQDTPLLDVLGELSTRTDVEFFISAEALAALGPKPEQARVTLEMSGVAAGTIVELLVQMRSLSVAVEEARVIVMPGNGKRDESKPLMEIPRSVDGAKKTITVKGVVVDEQGAPVAHAAVVSSCGEPAVSTESGDDGTFSFDAGRPFGGVHAQVPGHVASWEFSVDGNYGDTVDVRLALRGAAAVVEGVVRTADGREAVGAAVTVTLADSYGGVTPPKGARAPGPTFMTTGADGRYRADSLLPGDFAVAVRTGMGRPVTKNGTARPDETVHLDLTLPATTDWRGTLRDADGRPVAGATIQAGGHGFANTSADGSFALAGLEPGAVRVRVQTRGGAVVEKQVNVDAGAEFRFDLFVGGGPRISGRVVDEDGVPLANSYVQLLPRAPWLPSPRDAHVTGADGAFVFDELQPGAYRIAVLRTSPIPVVVSPETATGSDGVELCVPRAAMPTATLRAQIVDADGKPVAGASLFARDVATDAMTSASADGLGTLQLARLPRGRYLVWAGAGQGWTEVGLRDLGSGADLDLGAVHLDRERSVALRWGAEGDVTKATSYFTWWGLLSDGSATTNAAVLVLHGASPLDELKLTAGRYVIRVNGGSVQPFERTFDVVASGDVSITLPLRAAPERRIAPGFAGDAPQFARLRVIDGDGLVVESTYAGAPISVRLVPGRYRVEADMAAPAIETRRGTFDVPAENAPETFEVVLR